MSYDTLYKSFKKFIDNDDHRLTEQEQQTALVAFQNPKNRRVFQVSIILLLWSVIGAIIDSFIIGGSALAAAMTGPAWIQLLPTLIFSAINWILKCFFVYFYMKKEVPFNVAFMTGLQYVGFTILLGYTLKNDPEFKRGLQYYTKYLKKKGIRFIFKSLRDNKNTI